MFMLDEAIVEWGAISARRTCIVDGSRRLTFGELEQVSRARAIELRSVGVGAGDRVVVLAPNSTESVVAIAAVLRSGGVLVPVSAETKLPRLRSIIADCEPTAVIAPRSVLAELRGAQEDGDPIWIALDASFDRVLGFPFVRASNTPSADRVTSCHAGSIDRDVAVIVYTSGSSGEPKGVMLTHANLVNSTAAIGAYLGQSHRDVICCAIPIAFSYGLFQVLGAIRMGSTLVLERSFAFPYDTLRSIENHRVTILPAVPTMIARLVELLPRVSMELASLRCVTNAAAALPPAHALQMLELLPRAALHLMYGQTECTRACTLAPQLARDHPGSVGCAIPNSEVYLVDEAGRRLPAGSEGELVVRGANVMRGYWRKPSETESRLVGIGASGEKALRTGDRFRSSRNGLLSFVAREDEIFKCRGEKVAPAAVEHALCAIEGVCDAGVVGVEHPDDGMAIRASIVVREGVELDERRVRAQCRELLDPALVPRFIEFKRELPRTASGKLQRSSLAAMAGTG